jgi:cysteinyl-tRNA synthetase
VTVYDDSHIGHARTIVIFDILRRYLLSKGYKVEFVQNFTDVDDKIINRALSEGIPVEEISSRYILNYFRDFDSLNVLRADRYPKATEHILDMIRIIDVLFQKGFAYLSQNGVYFRVRSFKNYGKLSKKSVGQLEAGARVEIDRQKENPLDFALWKFESGPPAWNSPWGKGRPGWHIECSAMALKYFGSPFEIHGGGYDLVFPHHENEIAQSESFSGNRFARIWMHCGMVTVNLVKMSKSLGNIVTIQDAIFRYGPNSVRIYCMSVHYSKPLDYCETILNECKQKWRQIEICACELSFASGKNGSKEDVKQLSTNTSNAFNHAMQVDLNTSLATSIFLRFVNELNRLAAEEAITLSMAKFARTVFDNIMGVLGLGLKEVSEKERSQIESLIQLRSKLREQRKFQESDSIRRRLSEEFSVELIDHKHKTIWTVVE